MVFTPDDTDNYDYTGFILSQLVTITVNKATPAATFPTADEITYEQHLSASTLTGGSGDGSFAWESPDTIPTVLNSGYSVVFTPDDTDNYETVSQIIAISVQKAEQETPTVGGIPSTVTYGDSPFDLLGIGGNGTGSFSYSIKSGDAVSVSTSGTVTILKAGTAQITVTKAGDSNYLAASTDIPITVNKAVPIAVFPTAASLTYGQPLSDSVLTGGSGDGNFAWESPETIPTVINSGFDVVFTPDDTDNYLTIKRTVTLTVGKVAQALLTVSGIPDTITYGDSPFRLTVNGGSGAGSLSYSVITGNAVSVDASGTVTILRPGMAVLTVSKMEDDYYHATSATVEINVRRATSAEEIEETSSAPPMPSATPFSTVIPSPTGTTMPNSTATDASPSPTESLAPVTLKPLSIQTDESTGKFVATISIDNLPEGTAAIQLPSGQLIQIDTTQTTLQLQISQADLNKNGQLEIIALNAESIPMGNCLIDFTQEAWLQDTAENGADPFSVLLWIAAGVLVVGIATAATVIWHKKRR